MNTRFLLPLCLQLIKPREFLKAFLCIWVTVTKRKHFSSVMAGRSRSRTWINSAQSSGTRKIRQKLFPRRQSPIAIELQAFRREFHSAKSETCWALIDYKLSDLLSDSISLRIDSTRRSEEKRNWNPTIWNANWNWLCDNRRRSPMNSSSLDLRNLVRHKADSFTTFSFSRFRWIFWPQWPPVCFACFTLQQSRRNNTPNHWSSRPGRRAETPHLEPQRTAWCSSCAVPVRQKSRP